MWRSDLMTEWSTERLGLGGIYLPLQLSSRAARESTEMDLGQAVMGRDKYVS